MNNALAIFGALGGGVVFVGGVWAMLRGIFRLVGATDANTKATVDLSGKLEKLTARVDGQGERISRLEGRRRPGPPG